MLHNMILPGHRQSAGMPVLKKLYSFTNMSKNLCQPIILTSTTSNKRIQLIFFFPYNLLIQPFFTSAFKNNDAVFIFIHYLLCPM